MKKHLFLKTTLFASFMIFINWGFLSAQPQQSETYSWYHDYDVKFYKINLQASDSSLYIKGHTSILSVATIQHLDTFIFELGTHLSVDSITYNHRNTRFSRNGALVSVPLTDPVPRGKKLTVTVYYNGTVPSNGFFSSVSNKKDYRWHMPVTWSLSEPYGARDWFPCKQYLPDKADSAWIFITVPDHCKAGSNGLLTAVVPKPHHQVSYQWKTHYPIAYYLLSFTVANYQDYSYYAKLSDHDSLLIQNFIYNNPEYLAKYKKLIDATASYIRYYSSLFGPYPFMKEKYGHCLAPMDGGMEHQTMTTLANFDFTLVTHELAHQWFGDWVTCGTWNDIWINEGFASYGEYLSADKFKSHQAALNWMKMAHIFALQDTLGSVYVPDSGLNNDFRIFNYDLTYKKGASIIHELRYEINNDSLFFAILRHFLVRHADSVATGEDFEHMVSEATHKDYSWFFKQWYYGSGYPMYTLNWKQTKDTLFVTSLQSPSAKGIGLFKMHWDLQVNYTGRDTVIRVYQGKENELFKIPVKTKVSTIAADPEAWCLMQVLSINGPSSSDPDSETREN